MKTFLLIAFIGILFFGCKKDDINNAPSLTISALINITSTTAIAETNIITDGGTPVTMSGVCWSTNKNPTITDNKTTDGKSSGSFTSSISGLIPGLTYYVRGYAVNSKGTGYSSQINFSSLTSFEITNIKSSSSKIIIGQSNIFQAELTDYAGDIHYEWKFFYNNVQIEKTVYGLDLRTMKLNTKITGEYTVLLTTSRGKSEKSIFEKKFSVYDSNFQFGVWGDDIETIKVAESDNGYVIQTGLFRVPTIKKPGINDLVTLSYNKNSMRYTYYFNNGKLYAGSYVEIWTYVNSADLILRTAYVSYYSDKDRLENLLKITLPDGKIWKSYLSQSQINSWDQDAQTRWQAIGMGYLELKTEGASTIGKGSLYTYMTQVTTASDYLKNLVCTEHTLVSPD